MLARPGVQPEAGAGAWIEAGAEEGAAGVMVGSGVGSSGLRRY